MGIFLTACGSTVQKPQLTPLEIKSIQSKTFETPYDTAYKAVISVLQDLGYTIKNTDYGSGVITADSITTSKTDWFWTGNTYGKNTRITVSVISVKNKSQIRLNIIEVDYRSSAYGANSRNELRILDPKIYQNAFTKIENTIFIMQ